MKKLKMIFAVSVISSTLLLSTSIFANSTRVVVDDDIINFAKYGSEPFIDNGVTMLPLRSVFEEFDGYLDTSKYNSDKIIKFTDNDSEDNKTDTIVIDEANNKVTYNVFNEKENKRIASTSDIKVINKDGRLYLPIRTISEIFGYEVIWDASSKTIFIDTDYYDDLYDTPDFDDKFDLDDKFDFDDDDKYDDDDDKFDLFD